MQESNNENIEEYIGGFSTKSTSPCSLPPATMQTSTQIQALQEEILHLRAQVALLQSHLANYDSIPLNSPNLVNETNQHSISLNEEVDRKSNYTSDDLCETADIFDVEQKDRQPDKVKLQSDQTNPNGTTTFEIPITKMAERVKLQTTSKENNYITDTDPIESDINSTDGVEHLVTRMFHETDKEYDVIYRLKTEIQRLKVQNTVVTLTLTESKEHCEQLYLLCGKYESNAIALQQALNCSDRCVELYDVMLALLESKLALLEGTPGSEESRKAAETVAQHLLNRLNNDSSETINETSTGPWQEPVVFQPMDDLKPWTEKDEAYLRKHVSRLKGQRFRSQNTIVTLEAPFSYGKYGKESLSPPNTNRSRSRNDSRRIDLETAVLLQELNDYKSRVETAEREKIISQQQLATLQTALLNLQGQLADSEALLAMAARDRSSFSEAEYAVNIERELVEALARESRLKSRLQGLAGSLEAAAKSTANTERIGQIQQSHITELRQTNM